MAMAKAYDWFRPKIATLFAEAKAAGIATDVSVAVITDIVNTAPYNVSQVGTDEDWNRDIGEPDNMVNLDASQSPDLPVATTAQAFATPSVHFKD